MKKVLIFIIVLCLAAVPASAQKSILFLLPLGADNIAKTDIESINTQQDFDNLYSGLDSVYETVGVRVGVNTPYFL